MPSQRKSDTARANGAKSKGPKTAEGRERSSRNSLKHGITARHTMLLECEDPIAFQQLVDEYTAVYQPANPVERDLVNNIIGAQWRIQRLKIVEVALVDYEMTVRREEIAKKLTHFDSGVHLGLSFKGLSDDSRSVALLSRYESRLHRIYHRSHQAFLDLRRAIAAGLLGQQPTVQAPAAEPPPPEPVTETKPGTQPPSPAPRKKANNEPNINRVLRKIRTIQSVNEAFRRRRSSTTPGNGTPGELKNAS